jgi:hypothetical protein
LRRLPSILVLAAAFILVLALPAAATAPSDVIIEVESSFLGAPSPFVVSGPAVDDGLVCAAGEVIDYSGKVTGSSPNGFNFHGIKHFTCDDASGEFFVNMQARIDFRKGTTFNWNVLSGTGDYVDLHGAGSGVGLDICGPDCVFDLYDGGLHID